MQNKPLEQLIKIYLIYAWKKRQNKDLIDGIDLDAELSSIGFKELSFKDNEPNLDSLDQIRIFTKQNLSKSDRLFLDMLTLPYSERTFRPSIKQYIIDDYQKQLISTMENLLKLSTFRNILNQYILSNIPDLNNEINRNMSRNNVLAMFFSSLKGLAINDAPGLNKLNSSKIRKIIQLKDKKVESPNKEIEIK